VFANHRKEDKIYPLAAGLLSNLETARQERSVLLLDEQNLLVKEEKEGCA
jgi:hypothetical protein